MSHWAFTTQANELRMCSSCSSLPRDYMVTWLLCYVNLAVLEGLCWFKFSTASHRGLPRKDYRNQCFRRLKMACPFGRNLLRTTDSYIFSHCRKLVLKPFLFLLALLFPLFLFYSSITTGQLTIFFLFYTWRNIIYWQIYNSILLQISARFAYLWYFWERPHDDRPSSLTGKVKANMISSTLQGYIEQSLIHSVNL